MDDPLTQHLLSPSLHPPIALSTPAHQSPTNPSDPTTILIFTWADAGRKHIQKYVDGYRSFYPSSQITVVTATTVGTFFAGQKSARRVVREVVTRFHEDFQHHDSSSIAEVNASGLDNTSEHDDPPAAIATKRRRNNFTSADESALPTSRLLVHVFSNSGALNLEAACFVWNELQAEKSKAICQPTQPLPIRALVIDSTPGGASFRREVFRWVSGIVTGIAPSLSFLPGVIARSVAYLMGIFLVLVLMGLPRLFGRETIAARCRRTFNTTSDVSMGSVRLYVYSDGDALIRAEDVESHAREAKELGYRGVQMEMFKGTGHVQHMRSDPERYWGAVKRLWANVL